jgi:hypothetical protein
MDVLDVMIKYDIQNVFYIPVHFQTQQHVKFKDSYRLYDSRY